jgi:hypothetical protein
MHREVIRPGFGAVVSLIMLLGISTVRPVSAALPTAGETATDARRLFTAALMARRP